MLRKAGSVFLVVFGCSLVFLFADDGPDLTPQPTGPSVQSAEESAKAPPQSVEPSSTSDASFDDPIRERKRRVVASTNDTRLFFRNVLAIVMMSPGRYSLVSEVKKHYAQFFTHLYFCGPKTNLSFGIPIHGYDIVYGNEQYRAVSHIIKAYEGNRTIPGLEGYLYVADDLLLHPWMLTDRNKSKIWATQMGIANLKSSRPVNAVPGMSIQGKFRGMWPYWAKNRKKFAGVLAEGGPEMEAALQRSATKTHHRVFRWSKYPAALRDPESYKKAVFFTIVDTYYVPQRLALRCASLFDLMAKHWIFGEMAIPTALRVLDDSYEEMGIQFYWSSLKARDCHRYRWAIYTDGFHRCLHSHPFSDAIYTESVRQRVQTNKSLVKELLALSM